MYNLVNLNLWKDPVLVAGSFLMRRAQEFADDLICGLWTITYFQDFDSYNNIIYSIVSCR